MNLKLFCCFAVPRRNEGSTLRHIRLCTAGCAAALALAGATSAQAAGLAAPFATVNVSCAAGSAQTAPLTSDHPNAVARISANTAAAWWSANTTGGSDWVYPGDQLFGSQSAGSLLTNASPTVDLSSCTGGTGAALVSFYDVPKAPVTFPDSVQDPRSSREDLPFVVPSAARFVTDVALTQGTASVDRNTLASSGTLALGQLSAGTKSISVVALDGPPAHYRVSVRPLPVAVSALKAPTAMRAGAPETLSYTLDGDTTVTATLADASGAVRKTIASYATTSGSRQLTFDGRGDDGQPLPDGVYTATVRSNDPYGGSTQQSVQVRIDGSAPQVSVIAPSTSQNPIQVTASDVSGVASLSAGTADSFYDNGSGYGYDNPASRSTTVRAPTAGWTPDSTVQILVSAKDSLGNAVARVARSVRIPGPKSAAAAKRKGPLAATPARQKRSTVATRGLRVAGRGSGRVRIAVRVSKTTAKRLRSRSTTLAATTVTAQSGRFSARLKFSAKVRRAIRRRSGITVTVVLSGGASGSKKITVYR